MTNKTNIPIANIDILAEDFDSGIGDIVKKRGPEEIFHFAGDPLSVFLWYSQTRRTTIDLFSALKTNEQSKFDQAPTEYVDQANIIRKHFKNKLLLRRLKNLHMSKFMMSLERVLDNPHELREHDFKILAKMEDFYNEDTATEALFENYTSCTMKSTHGPLTFSGIVQYAGAVDRKSKMEKHRSFYFATEHNHLIRVSVPETDMGYSAWQFIADAGDKIKLTADEIVVRPHPGSDFRLMVLNNKYQIERAR
jgi:hypothetical protein